MHCLAVVSLAHSPKAIFQEEILVVFTVSEVQHLPFATLRGEQDCKLSTVKIPASFAYLLYCMFLIKRDSYLSGKSQDLNSIHSEQSEV